MIKAIIRTHFNWDEQREYWFIASRRRNMEFKTYSPRHMSPSYQRLMAIISGEKSIKTTDGYAIKS
jgi:hypothetical protein